ncbi:preprotein translocase subunit SecG [Candidatus Sumerlaeota bacterium]|nr:preprotein translocase subunit SecG [Candidatus Sumerlaeota bacterium]
MTFLFWLLFLAYLGASLVLILVVLLQSGKGGGLSGLMGAGSALGDHLGATGAEKALNRYTTYCAIGFLVINIFLVLLGNHVMNRSLVDKAVTGGHAEAISSVPTAPPEAPPIPAPDMAPTPVAAPLSDTGPANDNEATTSSATRENGPSAEPLPAQPSAP